MRSKSQILSKLRSDGHITDEEYKALEQEPCEYVVDHEKVNDILGHCIHNQEDYYLAIKMLNDLPPVNHCDKEYLEHHLECEIEKDEDDDGYACLFEYGREHSAVETFMDLISWHTPYGGHTSAIRACDLMGLEFSRDK